MNAAADNNTEKELIKKFQFVSKDRTESFEILIAELLVGKYSQHELKLSNSTATSSSHRNLQFLYMASGKGSRSVYVLHEEMFDG